MSEQLPVNFRDIGGVAGHGGRAIQRGRLFRGGQLFELPTAAKHALRDRQGIRTILDLRSAVELGKEPDGDIPGVRHVHFDVMQNVDALNKENPMRNTNADVAERYLTAVYGHFVTNDEANACFRGIAELLAGSPDGGVYFHCYAGKDRTGIVAAVLLSILGASEAAIFADYMRTAIGRREENARLVAEARQAGRTEDEVGAMAVFLGVKEGYLRNTFMAAERLYGSFDGYVRSGIGISDQTIDGIRAAYLE